MKMTHKSDQNWHLCKSIEMYYILALTPAFKRVSLQRF